MKSPRVLGRPLDASQIRRGPLSARCEFEPEWGPLSANQVRCEIGRGAGTQLPRMAQLGCTIGQEEPIQLVPHILILSSECSKFEWLAACRVFEKPARRQQHQFKQHRFQNPWFGWATTEDNKSGLV